MNFDLLQGIIRLIHIGASGDVDEVGWGNSKGFSGCVLATELGGDVKGLERQASSS